MKIAVVTSSYPRFEGDGIAPFIKSISESMHNRGHVIKVLAPFDCEVQPDTVSPFPIHRFKYAWPKKHHILGHAQSLKADVSLRFLVFLYLPFYLLASILGLIKLCKSVQAEIIHAHWVLPMGLPAAIVSKLLKIPLVISLHGSDIYISDKNVIFRGIARWVFSQSEYVTACSPELMDRAVKINPNIIAELYPYGADPMKFRPSVNKMDIREKYGWHKDEIIISTIGRFVYKKGFEYLIRTIPKLSHNHHKIRFVIGGSGPLENEYRTLISELGVEHIVSIPGLIPWGDVSEFLSASDIFVLPSVRDKGGNLDGLPNTLVEAMACGLPVIASNIGGVCLIIENEINGFLTEPENIEQLVEKVNFLIHNYDKRLELGKSARRSITEFHNWDNYSKRLEKNFLKIIS